MEVEAAFLGEGFEEVLDVLGGELADVVAVEGDVDRGVGAAAEVDGDEGERFVHRREGVAEARDAAALAERLVERLAEDEAGVLDEVVGVALDVAGGVDAEVEEAVAGELLEHVVEHADAGRDLVAAGAVDVEGEGDAGLAGAAFDVGAAVISQLPAPIALRASITRSVSSGLPTLMRMQLRRPGTSK